MVDNRKMGGIAHGATIGGAGALTLSDAKVRPQVMDQMGMVRCNVQGAVATSQGGVPWLDNMLWGIQDIEFLSKLGAPKMDRVLL